MSANRVPPTSSVANVTNLQSIIAGVDDTEIGYLNGVTSAIQTQLDAKVAKTLTTTTGDIIYASGANTPARLGIGSSAQVLTVASGVPSWATPASGGMTLISTTTMNAGNFTLSSIAGTYKHLKLVLVDVYLNTSAEFFWIRCNGDTGSNYQRRQYTLNATGVHGVAYGFEPGISKREGQPNRFIEEITPTMRSQMGDNQIAVASFVAPTLTASNDPSRSPQSTEVTNQVYAVYKASMEVRRLTPRECERLQGFPDDYTKIPYRNKSPEECPDGPRYKALGNSWAVPVIKWIGERIKMVEEKNR